MNLALVTKLKEIRKKSNHHTHKLSAVILKQGKPISFGFNSVLENYPYKSDHNLRNWHAEARAILSIKNKGLLKGSTIVVYREDKLGNPKKAKPCPTCSKLIKLYGIKTIIYSTEEGWFSE